MFLDKSLKDLRYYSLKVCRFESRLRQICKINFQQNYVNFLAIFSQWLRQLGYFDISSLEVLSKKLTQSEEFQIRFPNNRKKIWGIGLYIPIT